MITTSIRHKSSSDAIWNTYGALNTVTITLTNFWKHLLRLSVDIKSAFKEKNGKF